MTQQYQLAADHSSDLTVAAVDATQAAAGPSGNKGATTSDDAWVAQLVALRLDVTAPTVTIAVDGGQSNPTNSSPINFTVMFSEVVTDFATGDVTVAGTAGATTGTVTGSGTTYNVAVSGMSGSGTVVASTAAGVAHDYTGNASLASTTGSVDFESFATSSATTASLVLSKPSGTVAEDLLIAQILVDDGSDTSISPPDGWTLVRRDNEGNTLGQGLYYRIADGTEGVSFTWTISPANGAVGAIVRFSGVDTSTPFDPSAASGSIGSGNTGDSSTLTADGLTTTTAPTRVVAFFGFDDNSVFSTPGGMAERYELLVDMPNDDLGIAADDTVQSSAGSTGDKVSNSGGDAQWVAQLVALRAATVAAPSVVYDITDPNGNDRLRVPGRSDQRHGCNVCVLWGRSHCRGCGLGSEITSSASWIAADTPPAPAPGRIAPWLMALTPSTSERLTTSGTSVTRTHSPGWSTQRSRPARRSHRRSTATARSP